MNSGILNDIKTLMANRSADEERGRPFDRIRELEKTIKQRDETIERFRELTLSVDNLIQQPERLPLWEYLKVWNRIYNAREAITDGDMGK